MPPWNSAKAKVQLRLSVQRLRILQQKKEAQAKSSRRDIATLLEKGKVETASIKVETLINEDIHVELLELLELYCELLLARFGLLDVNTREPDPGIGEGVCSIIHAAPRTELKELHILRDILMHKYGREFSAAVMENHDGCVSDRVMRKLNVATPSTELVEAYLTEIARSYGIAWTPPPRSIDTNDDGGADGGVKEAVKAQDGDAEPVPAYTAAPAVITSPIVSDVKKDGPADVLPGGRTLKLPDLLPAEDEGKGKTTPAGTGRTNTTESPPPPPEDDFEALTRRFAALKKR